MSLLKILGIQWTCIILSFLVSPEARLVEDSTNQTYSEGDTAVIQCTSRGGPNNTYQWQFNTTNLDNETYQNLTLFGVTATNGGLYTCVVSNLAGFDMASTFVFISPYIVTEHGGVSTSTGSTVTLVCDAEAYPDPEYLWFRSDGEAIREEITNSSRDLIISSIEYGDEGGYYCVASARGRNITSLVGLIYGRC